jgi:hypothetical protein
MTDVKEPIREALEKLKELQSFESSYAEINKMQNLINTFANLSYAADQMAGEIGRQTGRSQEDVLNEYYHRVGILKD